MKTEILCIVDRSGSMDSMKKEAIGGFNGFLDDQKAVPDPANLTLVLFDYEYLKVHNRKNLPDVTPMDELQYQPRGSTALLDAMGRGISELREEILNEMKAEGTTTHPKVIVMILTDGEENASHEWKKDKIASLMDECRKDGWEIMFLGADMNGIEDAHSYGLNANNIVGFSNSAKGASRAFAYYSANVANYRMTGNISTTNDVSFIGDDETQDKKK